MLSQAGLVKIMQQYYLRQVVYNRAEHYRAEYLPSSVVPKKDETALPSSFADAEDGRAPVACTSHSHSPVCQIIWQWRSKTGVILQTYSQLSSRIN